MASVISARITALPPPSALMMIPESSGFTSFSITGDWLFPSSTVLSDWFSSLMTRELPELLPLSSVTEDVLLLSTCQILSSEDFNTTITSASPTPSTLFNSSRIRCSNFSS